MKRIITTVVFCGMLASPVFADQVRAGRVFDLVKSIAASYSYPHYPQVSLLGKLTRDQLFKLDVLTNDQLRLVSDLTYEQMVMIRDLNDDDLSVFSNFSNEKIFMISNHTDDDLLNKYADVLLGRGRFPDDN